jgi:UDP-N-acetyl-D-glucosamine dehydrogenase
MPFYPGPGLGGHCIPIDPFYLTWKAREYGKNTRFIELAGEINTAMPEHVMHCVADALNSHSKAVKGSRVLILGLAYKPNVDDERESPSYVLMDLLTERGAKVEYYDPYIPVIKPTREHSRWAGKKSIDWNQANIEAFDLVLIATNHDSVDCQELADWARCIVDTRNAMAKVKVAPGKVWKA